VLEGLGQEIDGLRHLITELRPAALDDLGLVPALEALARRAQAIDGLEIHTDIDLGDGERRLDPELESTLYRIVQEALTNVSRHAKATRAAISISEHDGRVTATVTDDGEGLPDGGPSRPRTPGEELKGGFGVSGMRERAELVGGELELVPAAGGGATMRLTVPLAGRPSAV
jgi:signal transduction histidine kinase